MSNFKVLNLSKHINNFFFDIRNEQKLNSCIKKIKPDIIFHLAAQSLVKIFYKPSIYYPN